jgi:putative transcriptional regulator
MTTMKHNYSGKLLIASPSMGQQSGFSQTVILIVKHDAEEGALGLCINRPCSHTIKEVWHDISEGEDWQCQRDDPLYQGGPCLGPLSAIHTREILSEEVVIPGQIFFTSRDTHLTELFKSLDEDPYKIVNGYSGWSPGQLENEIKHGSWLTLNASHVILFSTEEPEELWKRCKNEIGFSIYKKMGINVQDTDASMN